MIIFFGIGPLALTTGSLVDAVLLVAAIRRARGEPRGAIRWLLTGWLAVAVLAGPIALLMVGLPTGGAP